MQQLGLKLLRLIAQVCALFLLSELGQWIMASLHIKFPGSIVGLFILLILLFTKVIPEKWIASGAELLLAYMTLFFIPVTVGIIGYPELFSWKGLLIIGIILISTILSIISAGKTTQLVEKYYIDNQNENQNESQKEEVSETRFETIPQKGEV
ncbi:CidA/LrgA family holin-like protein [Rummeliibacillus sp. JY-2-4R]